MDSEATAPPLMNLPEEDNDAIIEQLTYLGHSFSKMMIEVRKELPPNR